MKYIVSFIVTAFFLGSTIAQVGIGTINPEEDLHIAGTTSTVRIESLDATNNPTYNNGTDLAPVFVDGNGDIVLGNGTGASGQEPFNFLIDVPNFVPDDPYTLGYGSGSVVNSNDLGETQVEGQITTIAFTVPNDAIVEVKYGITLLIAGNDLSASVPTNYVDFDQAVSLMTFFKVDLDSDGLDTTEATKEYGHKAQYYATSNQGLIGYPYMNGQAYFTVPQGSHTLYFYGRINDSATSYTSVGFGGAQDFLKIRIYN